MLIYMIIYKDSQITASKINLYYHNWCDIVDRFNKTQHVLHGDQLPAVICIFYGDDICNL